MLIVHARVIVIVHSCIMIIIHAYTMIIVDAYIMVIVHACMIIVHACSTIIILICIGIIIHACIITIVSACTSIKTLIHSALWSYYTHVCTTIITQARTVTCVYYDRSRYYDHNTCMYHDQRSCSLSLSAHARLIWGRGFGERVASDKQWVLGGRNLRNDDKIIVACLGSRDRSSELLVILRWRQLTMKLIR